MSKRPDLTGLWRLWGGVPIIAATAVLSSAIGVLAAHHHDAAAAAAHPISPVSSPAVAVTPATGGTSSTTSVSDPPLAPIHTHDLARDWTPLGTHDVKVTMPYCGDWQPGPVTIGGVSYNDPNSGNLVFEPFSQCFSGIEFHPYDFDIGFVLSRRFARFRVTLGIPDDASCCPQPTVSYTIDSGTATVPVDLRLGRPYVLELDNTAAVSRVDVDLRVSSAWTSAIGGAEGFPL